MDINFKKIALVAALATSFPAVIQAVEPIDYEASVAGVAASGDFAPYFIGSMNGGKYVRKDQLLLDVNAAIKPDTARRFRWGVGLEVIAGYSSSNDYSLWDASANEWTSRSNRPSAAWIQQLYGELEYRSIRLRVGQEQPHSALLDESLSSGDLTRSGNARGIPGVSLGFNDFQDIPFTNGWVQIDGVIDYGRFTDDGFKEKQYNYYTWLTTSDVYYTYKRCYFRTKPTKPFSVTVGMQTAGQFGGTSTYYKQGVEYKHEHRGFKIKDVFKMFLPVQGNGNSFYEGNTLGSWDFKARYRLPSGDEIEFATQWPWEDGSGIGRRNGLDGLWGLYYRSARRSFINGACIEWLDFRNQSGPIHYAPADAPGSTITTEATGGDNNYNNDTYCAYTNYGMAIATPFLVSPIYNLNGYPAFLHNCARGLHLAMTGSVGRTFDYTLKYSWQQAWGMGRQPQAYCKIDNSAMLDVAWDASVITDGLRIKATVAFDAGRLRGNTFGTMLSICYTGRLNLKK